MRPYTKHIAVPTSNSQFRRTMVDILQKIYIVSRKILCEKKAGMIVFSCQKK